MAVASCVENDEPSGNVPVNIPFAMVPVTVVVAPAFAPPDVAPAFAPLDVVPVVILCIDPHPLFRATTACPLYSVSIGCCSALLTPKAFNTGPSARIKTRRGIVPAMTNPTIAVFPSPTVARADTLESGAAPGICARLNRPVVVFVPVTVV